MIDLKSLIAFNSVPAVNGASSQRPAASLHAVLPAVEGVPSLMSLELPAVAGVSALGIIGFEICLLILHVGISSTEICLRTIIGKYCPVVVFVFAAEPVEVLSVPFSFMDDLTFLFTVQTCGG